MSDADSSGFGKFIPGFEFMQNLARQASGGLAQGVQQAVPQLPNLGSWVAPTFNVEDLEKRIQELKAVHFWLDQNARALSATIQALEVQKMTLATLKGMNLSMGDVASALKMKATDTMAASMAGLASMGGFGASAKPEAAPVQPPAAPAPAATPAPAPFNFFAMPTAPTASAPVPAQAPIPVPAPAAPAASPYFFASAPAATPVPAPAPETPPPAPVAAAAEPAGAPAGGVVDPMQWWGSLTQQFQAIAANALKDNAAQTAVDASKHIASALTREAVKTATEMTSGLTRGLVGQPKPADESASGAAEGLKAAATKAVKKAATKTVTKAATTAVKAAVRSAAPAARKPAKAAAPSPAPAKAAAPARKAAAKKAPASGSARSR